jgi:cysteine sulfinate desulfinase/cysteine desulfurase-like protein
VRFSLSRRNTDEEVERAVAIVARAVAGVGLAPSFSGLVEVGARGGAA